MAKFTALWNYQRKKTGEIVIAEEELQKMLDAAWDAGYNEGKSRNHSAPDPADTPAHQLQNRSGMQHSRI